MSSTKWVVTAGTPTQGHINTLPITPLAHAEQSAVQKLKVAGQPVSRKQDVNTTHNMQYKVWPYNNVPYQAGTLAFSKINQIKLSKKLKVQGQPVALAGAIDNEHRVLAPATIPPPVSSSDPAPQYPAKMNLQPQHNKLKAA
ncbi:MAG: hypothetical protein AAF669_07975 [Pseudomonadota bacterium]